MCVAFHKHPDVLKTDVRMADEDDSETVSTNQRQIVLGRGWGQENHNEPPHQLVQLSVQYHRAQPDPFSLHEDTGHKHQ